MRARHSLLLPLLSLLLLLASSCHEEKDRTIAPCEAMQRALNLKAEGDFRAYFACLDFGEELDSAQQSIFVTALLRQVQLDRELRSGMQGARVLSAQMPCDTVATVFYRQYFANGDSLDCSQKMVRQSDGVWRLRMRN